MDYIESNKAAWEEAFEHRRDGWGDENYERLMTETLPFFNEDVKRELRQIDFTGKEVGHFCCNNGRELLSLMGLGAAKGTGFDIAGNILAQARETAEKANIENCQFVEGNILEIDSRYEGCFDVVLFTVGALTWIEDIRTLFSIVSRCLKTGGLLLINDFHPFVNMMPAPGEPEFDGERPDRITYPYFRAEPFVEKGGMEYMTESYESKTFISFAHTLSGLINAITEAGMSIRKFDEFDYDVGITEAYDHMGYPMSYILLAEKIGLGVQQR